MRRLRGRSSGDGRSAKRPELVPVAPLFHLVAPGEWPQAGEYRPASLDTEGFVHFSFADQVEASANRHYRDADALAVVEVDPMRLGVPIRVEDSYGRGTAFPHAYGPVPVTAATEVRPLTPGRRRPLDLHSWWWRSRRCIAGSLSHHGSSRSTAGRGSSSCSPCRAARSASSTASTRAASRASARSQRR